MTVNLSALAGAGQQFFDDNGTPLAGGKLYSYVAGTTTPQVAYTSASGVTPLSNPIILNSAGRVATGEIWLTTGNNYKFVLKTSTDVTIATWDNIIGINGISTTLNALDVIYDPAGTGAVTTNAQAKFRQTVSVFDFMTSAQIADVQAGTASIDCLDSFIAAKNSFSSALDSLFYAYAGTIYVPPGRYYLSNTFVIDRNLKLIGAGAPFGNDLGPSQLVFADNCDGILIVDYRDSPNNKQGSGLVIQDLSLKPKVVGVGVTGSGISLKATARLINVMCIGWPEHGIKIDASTAYTPASNANVWYLSGCTTTLNTGNGLYVNGDDANAGACYSHNAIANKGWGIFDSSFLGNTYVGCHTSDNIAGSYKSDNLNARNLFLGCYSEGGQPSAQIIGPSLVVGGLIDVSSTTFAINGGTVAINFKGNIAVPTVNLGYLQSNDSGIGLSYADTSTPNIYSWTFGKQTGRWGYKWANLGTFGFFQFFDRSATITNGYPRSLAASNGAVGISSYYFGSAAQMLNRSLGSAIPTTGSHLNGDIVYDETPSASGYIGWVCTTSGTFGTLNAGATTGSITSGATLLVVNSATGLTEGCYITIAGVAGIKLVSAISGLNITITAAANATVSAAAVAFSPAVYKTWGAISA